MNKKKYKLPKKQTGHLTRAIIYGIFALLCFTNIKALWSMMLILLAVSAFYTYLWFKHRNDKSFTEIVKKLWKETDGIKEEDEEKEFSELSRKEQKKTYQDYMSEIDKQFDDEELDRQIAELEGNENEDLYIR